MTEFVEQWVDGKLKLVPKDKVGAAGVRAPAAQSPVFQPSPQALAAMEGVCSQVRTTTGNVVGAPAGAEENERRHPFVDMLYHGAGTIKRRLWERVAAGKTRNLT